MNSHIATIEAGLARRHRATRRLKQYGILALLFASAMLLWLMASIIAPGLKGFMRHEIVLASDAHARDASRDDEGHVNYNRALQRAFDRVLVNLNTSASPRERYTLLGDFAMFEAERAWQEAGETDVKEVRFAVPLADAADQYFKSYGERAGALSQPQRHILDSLKDAGLVHYRINTDFFSRGDSRAPESAGFLGSMVGSLLLVIVAMALALPVGVMGAIYLEEFAPKNRMSDIIEVSINNLAAVPSIIFGLLGLTLYLLWFDLPRSSALVGGLTIALMVLPTIIITTRASLKAVPPSVRHAAIALGAAPTQVVRHHVLPYALPGIMTGTILGVARALGETAPLLMIGMVAFVADIPRGFFDPATAMPVSIYIWASSPELGFVEKTASGILLLIVILMALNAAAIYIRNRFELRW
ncbi:MAG: phosphate ABC transporter, permease protein PstA [Alphaproteobacteria bacterium]|nr:phosphate ABC transporter, permease protein PstA [Alphaproteobacteria bacterium]